MMMLFVMQSCLLSLICSYAKFKDGGFDMVNSYHLILLQVSHSSVMNMCRSHKQISELYPSREVALCLDPYSGFGLVLWILSG